MEILNKWTIVLTIATFLSLLVHWCKISYLDPILELEKEVKSRVKKNTTYKLSAYKEIVDDVGHEKFIDTMYDEIAFQKMVRSTKHIFRSQLISACLFVATTSFFSVALSDLIPDDVFTVILTIISVAILYLWGRFSELKKYERAISEYVDGGDPTMIISEIEN